MLELAMMSSYDAAYNEAQRLLSESLPRRWKHVQAVGAKAVEVGESIFPESEASVLATAAILHDIGYAPTIADTGFHSLDGARWLRKRGWNDRIACLVAHHSCALKEADERGLRVELESEFENEDSAVTDALWYCDMTTGPDGQAVQVRERLDEILSRYGADHVVSRFITRARNDIIGAVHRTEKRLEAA
jgi:HD superfamily phosphodiesterase